MDKSRWLALAVAGAIAAAGGAWMQQRGGTTSHADKAAAPQTTTNAANAANATDANSKMDLLKTLSAGQLKQVSGEAFQWKPGAGNGKSGVSVINFWATWCGPCVEEMPELDKLSKTLAPASVIGVAIDNATNVKGFLEKTPVTYPIALAGLEGTDLMRELGNQQGGLPFTVLIDKNGKLLFTKMGKTNEKELLAELAKH